MRLPVLLRILALRSAGSHVSLDGVRVDRQSTVARDANLAHHVELLATNVARFASIGRYSKCHFADIGPFDSIAWDVTIGATGHPLDRASTHSFPYRHDFGLAEVDSPVERPRTRLGPDTWVGAHAVIMPGVNVGPGTIIGAGSIVTRDVPAYSVVAGSPARLLRMRVPDEMAARLLDVAWWDWPTAALHRAIPLFQVPVDERVLDGLEAIARELREDAAQA